MDTFLTDLYEQEVEKVASADYDRFLRSLSVDELEELAGLRKVAVDGKTEPSLPTGGSMKESGKCPACMPKKTTPPELPIGGEKKAASKVTYVDVRKALKHLGANALKRSAVGAALGGASGAINAPSGSKGRSAVKGALKGGAIGAVIGALVGKVPIKGTIAHTSDKKKVVDEIGSVWPKGKPGTKLAGALEKKVLPAGGAAVGDSGAGEQVGDQEARKVLDNLTNFDVKSSLEQAKVAGIGSAIIPRVSSLASKHPGLVIPAMSAGAGAVAGAASAPPGSRISGALGGAALGAGMGAGGQHLLRKAGPFKAVAPKLASAQMLVTAMRATRSAPDGIKQAAIKLAAIKLALSGEPGSMTALPALGGAIGALAAPPGEAPRGAVRGAMTAGGLGMGMLGGSEIGHALVHRHPTSLLANLAGLAAIPAGTLIGGAAGNTIGRTLLPYRVGPEAQQQAGEVAADDEGTKSAAVLSLKKRESLPASKFAVPERAAKRIGVAGEIQGSSKGKYPIPDKVHARAALQMVAKHGTEAEKSMVRSKVHAKYPEIGKEASIKLAISDQFIRRIARKAGPGRVAQFVKDNEQMMQKNEDAGLLRGIVRRYHAGEEAKSAISDRALGSIHGVTTPGFRDPDLHATQELPVFTGGGVEAINEQPTVVNPLMRAITSVHDRPTLTMPAIVDKTAGVKVAISADFIRRAASSPRVSMRRASQFVERNKALGDRLFREENPLASPIRRYDAANAAKQGLAEKVLKGMQASNEHLQGLKPAAAKATGPSRGWLRSQLTPSFAAG